jgi:hypothetical protein
MRGLGAPGMALSMIVLLYVAGRIGYEVGGFIGAVIPVVAFLLVVHTPIGRRLTK